METIAAVSAFAQKVGPIVGLASGAVSLVTGITGGMAARDQAEAQARLYEQQRADASAAAADEEAQKRRELSRVLAQQDGLRAGRGVELYSATGDAIRGDAIAEAESDILAMRTNYNRLGSRLGLQAETSRAQGRSAFYAGIGQGVTGFLRGASAAGQGGGGSKTSKWDGAASAGGVSRSAYMAGYDGSG